MARNHLATAYRSIHRGKAMAERLAFRRQIRRVRSRPEKLTHSVALQTRPLALAIALATGIALGAQQKQGGTFSVEQILSLPAPDNLVVAPIGSTIAWTFNER